MPPTSAFSWYTPFRLYIWNSPLNQPSKFQKKWHGSAKNIHLDKFPPYMSTFWVTSWNVPTQRAVRILTAPILAGGGGRLRLKTGSMCIVSVLYRNKGGIGKSSPTAKGFPTTSQISWGRWVWISQYFPRFGGAQLECDRRVNFRILWARGSIWSKHLKGRS